MSDDRHEPMDLSPRDVPDEPTRKRRRKWMPIVALALVVVAGGVIVTQFLTSAVDYYCNVDEIGERSGCDEGRTLRVQGTVDAGSIDRQGDTTEFTMSFGGATLPVRYSGDPGGMFKECIPVVVRGSIGDDGVFDGSEVEVKHSNEYEAENSERLDGAASDSGAKCSPQA